MALYLGQALELPILQSARLITKGLDVNRIITGVGIIEPPVEHFVRSGDLVLSTGINVGKDATLLTRFVRDIASSEATALMLAVGPHALGFTPQARRVARSYGMPLFELPWKIRFSDISESVLRLILSEQLETRRRDDFIWSLADGTFRSVELVHSQAKRLGYDLAQPYIALVGETEKNDDTSVSQLLHELHQRASEQRVTCLETFSGHRLVAFLQTQKPSLVEKLVKGLAATWGVSEVFTEIKTFPHAYQTAQTALRIGLQLSGSKSITHAGDTLLAQLLLRMAGESETYRLRERYLKPLEQYQEAKGVDVLQTLRVYFEMQGDTSKTARHLGVHRQTLLHRLSKIQDITQCDLTKADDRLALELCLRLLPSTPSL
jgi:DNA-binding PucR family transcriptional regulator